MRRIIPAIFAAVWGLEGPCLGALLAGAARRPITPVVETFSDANRNRRYDPGEPFRDLNGNGVWDPVWLAGYGGGRFATGVHDDLWARALVLTEDRRTLIWVTLDLIGYLFDEVAQVRREVEKRFKIPASQVLIVSAHDHSGPDTIGLWGEGGKSGRDPRYLESVREAILACIEEALKDQRPARMAVGKARYANPIEDSRPPDVKNDLLLSLRLEDESGRTLATLVNYAMHAEVLDGDNRRITSDYPGVLREELEKRYGGTAFFFPADIGGMQSPFVFFHSFWSRGRVGQAIAQEVIASLDGQPAQAVSGFEFRYRDLLLPVDNLRFLGAIEKGLFGAADRYAVRKDDRVFLPCNVNWIRLGPVEIVTVPGEAFPELGRLFRAEMRSEFPFFIGLCNNEIGYIVPDEEWDEKGYEEAMSLGRKTAPLLLQAFMALVSRSR